MRLRLLLLLLAASLVPLAIGVGIIRVSELNGAPIDSQALSVSGMVSRNRQTELNEYVSDVQVADPASVSMVRNDYGDTQFGGGLFDNSLNMGRFDWVANDWIAVIWDHELRGFKLSRWSMGDAKMASEVQLEHRPLLVEYHQRKERTFGVFVIPGRGMTVAHCNTLNSTTPELTAEEYGEQPLGLVGWPSFVPLYTLPNDIVILHGLCDMDQPVARLLFMATKRGRMKDAVFQLFKINLGDSAVKVNGTLAPTYLDELHPDNVTTVDLNLTMDPQCYVSTINTTDRTCAASDRADRCNLGYTCVEGKIEHIESMTWDAKRQLIYVAASMQKQQVFLVLNETTGIFTLFNVNPGDWAWLKAKSGLHTANGMHFTAGYRTLAQDRAKDKRVFAISYATEMPYSGQAFEDNAQRKLVGAFTVPMPSHLNSVDMGHPGNAPVMTLIKFADSSDRIVVNFEGKTDYGACHLYRDNTGRYPAGFCPCSTLFVDISARKLGEYSTCGWQDDSTLILYFGYGATVVPTDILTLRTKVICHYIDYYLCAFGSMVVTKPDTGPVPDAMIVGVSKSTYCDSVSLDATYSSGGAGRSLNFTWGLEGCYPNTSNVWVNVTQPLQAMLNYQNEFDNQNEYLDLIDLTTGESIFPMTKCNCSFTLDSANFLGKVNNASASHTLKIELEPLPQIKLSSPPNVYIKTSDALEITASAAFSACGGKSKIGFLWTSQGSFLTGTTQPFEAGNTAIENYLEKALTVTRPGLYLKKNTFLAGYYKLKVVGYMKEDPNKFGEAEVVINVVASPLVARILGGNRTVTRSQDVALVEDCYDPDDQGDLNPMIIRWYDALALTNVERTKVAADIDAMYAEPIHTGESFDPATFTEWTQVSDNSQYNYVDAALTQINIMIIATKNEGADESKWRSTRAYATITFTDMTDIPALGAHAMQDQKIDPDSKFTMSACIFGATTNCTVPSDDDTTVRFEWGFVISDNKAISMTLSTPIALPTVVVAPKSLTPGYFYTFSVNGYTAAGELADPMEFSQATILIEVNSPPIAGRFTVEPRVGYAMNTSFTFFSDGYTDPDVPIKYQYGYLPASLTDTPLTGRSQTKTATFKLPTSGFPDSCAWTWPLSEGPYYPDEQGVTAGTMEFAFLCGDTYQEVCCGSTQYPADTAPNALGVYVTDGYQDLDTGFRNGTTAAEVLCPGMFFGLGLVSDSYGTSTRVKLDLCVYKFVVTNMTKFRLDMEAELQDHMNAGNKDMAQQNINGGADVINNQVAEAQTVQRNVMMLGELLSESDQKSQAQLDADYAEEIKMRADMRNNSLGNSKQMMAENELTSDSLDSMTGLFTAICGGSPAEQTEYAEDEQYMGMFRTYAAVGTELAPQTSKALMQNCVEWGQNQIMNPSFGNALPECDKTLLTRLSLGTGRNYTQEYYDCKVVYDERSARSKAMSFRVETLVKMCLQTRMTEAACGEAGTSNKAGGSSTKPPTVEIAGKSDTPATMSGSKATMSGGYAFQFPQDMFDSMDSAPACANREAQTNKKNKFSYSTSANTIKSGTVDLSVPGVTVANLTTPIELAIPADLSNTSAAGGSASLLAMRERHGDLDFHLLSSKALISPSCKFWDYDMNEGVGGYSTAGCVVGSASGGQVKCMCNHLSDFGVAVESSVPEMNTVDPIGDASLLLTLDASNMHALLVVIALWLIWYMIWVFGGQADAEALRSMPQDLHGEDRKLKGVYTKEQYKELLKMLNDGSLWSEMGDASTSTDKKLKLKEKYESQSKVEKFMSQLAMSILNSHRIVGIFNHEPADPFDRRMRATCMLCTILGAFFSTALFWNTGTEETISVLTILIVAVICSMIMLFPNTLFVTLFRMSGKPMLRKTPVKKALPPQGGLLAPPKKKRNGAKKGDAGAVTGLGDAMHGLGAKKGMPASKRGKNAWDDLIESMNRKRFENMSPVDIIVVKVQRAFRAKISKRKRAEQKWERDLVAMSKSKAVTNMKKMKAGEKERLALILGTIDNPEGFQKTGPKAPPPAKASAPAGDGKKKGKAAAVVSSTATTTAAARPTRGKRPAASAAGPASIGGGGSADGSVIGIGMSGPSSRASTSVAGGSTSVVPSVIDSLVIKIQNRWRGHRARRVVQLLMREQAEARDRRTRDSMSPIDIGVSKIQALVRGFRVRKKFRKPQSHQASYGAGGGGGGRRASSKGGRGAPPPSAPKASRPQLSPIDMYVIHTQAVFRGYLCRRKLREQGIPIRWVEATPVQLAASGGGSATGTGSGSGQGQGRGSGDTPQLPRAMVNADAVSSSNGGGEGGGAARAVNLSMNARLPPAPGRPQLATMARMSTMAGGARGSFPKPALSSTNASSLASGSAGPAGLPPPPTPISKDPWRTGPVAPGMSGSSTPVPPLAVKNVTELAPIKNPRTRAMPAGGNGEQEVVGHYARMEQKHNPAAIDRLVTKIQARVRGIKARRRVFLLRQLYDSKAQTAINRSRVQRNYLGFDAPQREELSDKLLHLAPMSQAQIDAKAQRRAAQTIMNEGGGTKEQKLKLKSRKKRANDIKYYELTILRPPTWLKSVTYMLALLFAMIMSYFVMIYGVKFQPAVSKAWLQASGITSIQEMALNEPLRCATDSFKKVFMAAGEEVLGQGFSTMLVKNLRVTYNL